MQFALTLNIVLMAVWLALAVVPFLLDPPLTFSWSIFKIYSALQLLQGFGLDSTFWLYGEEQHLLPVLLIYAVAPSCTCRLSLLEAVINSLQDHCSETKLNKTGLRGLLTCCSDDNSGLTQVVTRTLKVQAPTQNSGLT